MNIKKYEHACLVVEEQGKKLIIDPGIYTTSPYDYSNTAAIVITHVHTDHFDVEAVRKIVAQNPNVRIFGTAEVAKEIADLSVTTVTGGDTASVEPFKLEFFGSLHATVHAEMPRAQNVGVMINDTLYYPGDSFASPNRRVKVLATPTSGPWLKLGEIIDFLRTIKPTYTFPTHNALLSDIGEDITNDRVKKVCGEFDGQFMYLKPGESLSV